MLEVIDLPGCIVEDNGDCSGMDFRHSDDIWTSFPELSGGVLWTGGVTSEAPVGPHIEAFQATARARLAAGSESELPEINAWRRVFSRMGLKPTQYRCASEALLRRFRKENALPQIHPLIDLCNAVSLAFAIPVAVLDLARVEGDLTVRHATGSESYLAFSGETEHPEPREVIFADAADNAHARRWTNRQSALSAVRPETATVLIVAEAVHETAAADVERLIAALRQAIVSAWPATAPRTALLGRDAPRFEF
jgi:DNA/RNA-binding domain of Phe-tRNA-synthetase-like protein